MNYKVSFYTQSQKMIDTPSRSTINKHCTAYILQMLKVHSLIPRKGAAALHVFYALNFRLQSFKIMKLTEYTKSCVWCRFNKVSI